MVVIKINMQRSTLNLDYCVSKVEMT